MVSVTIGSLLLEGVTESSVTGLPSLKYRALDSSEALFLHHLSCLVPAFIRGSSTNALCSVNISPLPWASTFKDRAVHHAMLSYGQECLVKPESSAV